MGLFSFLKKKEEALELEEPDFREYFKKAVNARYSKLNAKIHEMSVENKYHVRKAKEYLHHFTKEELMNPNVLPKAYHMMDGNRKHYIQRWNQFLDEIIVPDSYFEINQACTTFFESLESTTKETQKNYFVLKEFFENTLSKVNKKIKTIENLFIELKTLLDKENIALIDEISAMFNEVDIQRKLLAELHEKKEAGDAELTILENEVIKIDKKIVTLANSNDYRFYKHFLKEKEQIAQQEHLIKQEIIELFSECEKGLKKFAKGSKSTAQHYLENAVDALLDDEKLSIYTTLQSVKKAAEQGKLDLKAKKKDKIIETIKGATKKELTEKRKSLVAIQQEKKENAEKIRKNTTSLQLREQQGYKKNNLQKIEDQNQLLARIESKIESTNPNLVLQEIVKKLGELSGRNIKWKR